MPFYRLCHDWNSYLWNETAQNQRLPVGKRMNWLVRRKKDAKAKAMLFAKWGVLCRKSPAVY